MVSKMRRQTSVEVLCKVMSYLGGVGRSGGASQHVFSDISEVSSVIWRGHIARMFKHDLVAVIVQQVVPVCRVKATGLEEALWNHTRLHLLRSVRRACSFM